MKVDHKSSYSWVLDNKQEMDILGLGVFQVNNWLIFFTSVITIFYL